MLKEHRHPKFDEYIYVVSGSIINWIDSDSQAKIITPPEEVDIHNGNEEGWHKIPAGMNHRIQCMKPNTHFVSKFLRSDVESD
jgi:quercetin dioxygenase-like cupin family protein